MSDRRNKREKEQLFNMPEIAKLEKKSFSGAMEKLEDSKLKKVLIWVFEIAVTLIFAVLTSMMLFQSVTMQESLGYTAITNGWNNSTRYGSTNYWNNRNNLYALVNGEYQKVTVSRSGNARYPTYTYTLPNNTTIVTPQ